MIRKILKYGLWIVLGVVTIGLLYGWSLYRDIRQLAKQDSAHAADAIVVLGAAQYNGRPSPVLKARLDHALELYRRGYARAIITTPTTRKHRSAPSIWFNRGSMRTASLPNREV
jgi:vancomycin permeability regulator SanA